MAESTAGLQGDPDARTDRPLLPLRLPARRRRVRRRHSDRADFARDTRTRGARLSPAGDRLSRRHSLAADRTRSVRLPVESVPRTLQRRGRLRDDLRLRLDRLYRPAPAGLVLAI